MKKCTTCSERSTCKDLCDRVEKYANQDYRYQRELAVSETIIDAISQGELIWPELTSFFHESSIDFSFLTPLQNKILHLFHFEGKTYKQIATAYNIRSNAVKWQLQSARKKITSIYTNK